MSNQLEKLTNSVAKAVETVPDIYNDGFKPSTQESGKLLALIPRSINAALVPLRQWVSEREYSLAVTEKLLAEKLKNISPEKIVTPETYVAIPAIQAISYSMNSDELRNLYANLLAKSVNIDTKDAVHPSFVEIIKQLSPLDAKVFKLIMERDVNPCANFQYKNNKDGTFRDIMTNITDFNIAHQQLICVSIDNLFKQNLINIPNDGHYSNESVYNTIINSDLYKEQEFLYPKSSDGFKFTILKKMINKTNLGNSFYKTCILE